MSTRPQLTRTIPVLGIMLLVVGAAFAAPAKPAGDGGGGPPRVERTIPVTPVSLSGTARVNLAELARQQARASGLARPPVRPLIQNEMDGEEDMAQPNERGLAPTLRFGLGRTLHTASPAPIRSFAGLDDIAMVDSSYIIIPPDVNGAVGPTMIFQNLNNNVRILDKGTGAVLATVGVNTWWAPTGASPNNYSDPRSVYDPYQQRFLTITEGDLDQSTANTICLGVSDTNDPTGSWHLYRFVVYESSTYQYADYPTLGFSRNWITISCNFFNRLQTAVRRSVFAIHYPSLLAGTFTGYRADYGTSGVICGAPCLTYSATCDTQYIVQRRGTSSYSLDMITGTGPDAPTYTTGAALTRPGGSWGAMGSSNWLPQAPPEAGTSVCGSPPCTIERTDDNVRTAPIYRGGSIWFTQAVGLPAGGVTHVAAQWTQITTPSGAFTIGGRLQDTTATVSNGGPHYAFPSMAVNANGDFLLGFTRFSSAQHPAAGYAMHLAADGEGTLREAAVYKDGEDYYHKTFSTNTGRNRWGDFSTSQVDPSDDVTLWTVQQYAKARTGTDDGTTGTNSSKWGTWWAAVTPQVSYLITATAGPGGTISPSGDVTVPGGGNQGFTIAADTCHTIADVLVNGVSQGPIASYTFTDVQAPQTIAVSFALRTFTIAASAGPGGAIAPSGDVAVGCAADQTFHIAPDPADHVLDVLVDGVSAGAETTYTFHDVTAPHTIAASFSVNTFAVTATATGRGGVTKDPSLAWYPYGSTVQLTPVPDPGWAFTAWSGDTTTTADPLGLFVTRNWSVVAGFADVAPPEVHVTYPVGGEHLTVGDQANLTWTATDNVAVARVDLYLARAGTGGPYDSLAGGVPNDGTYAWTVSAPTTSQAFFRVVAHDSAGNGAAALSDSAFAILDVTAVGEGRVTDFALTSVGPNPARGRCRVAFAVPQAATVRVSILDVLGREVAVLADGEQSPGRHEVTWSDATGRVRPGLYFVRMSVPGRTFLKRIVMIQ